MEVKIHNKVQQFAPGGAERSFAVAGSKGSA